MDGRTNKRVCPYVRLCSSGPHNTHTQSSFRSLSLSIKPSLHASSRRRSIRRGQSMCEHVRCSTPPVCVSRLQRLLYTYVRTVRREGEVMAKGIDLESRGRAGG